MLQTLNLTVDLANNKNLTQYSGVGRGGGVNLPPMVGIGLTELQNAWGVGAEAPPSPSLAAPLQYKCVICIELIRGMHRLFNLTCEKKIQLNQR